MNNWYIGLTSEQQNFIFEGCFGLLFFAVALILLLLFILGCKLISEYL